MDDIFGLRDLMCAVAWAGLLALYKGRPRC